MVMLLRDVWRECKLCGYEVFSRNMEETPLHSLTVRRLIQLAHAPALSDAPECPQCGEPASEDDVKVAVMRYLLPSGRGIIEAYRQPEGITWQVRPEHPADIQLTPHWSPDLEPPWGHTLEEVTESSLEAVFKRPFNAKEAFRRRYHRDELLSLAPGLWAVPRVGSAAEAIDAVVSAGGLRAALVAEPLQEAEAWRGGYLGSPAAFVGDLPLTAEGGWWGVASHGVVAASLDIILRQLPITMKLWPEAQGELRLAIAEAPDSELGPIIKPALVAAEAARTLLVPADAARLELDRALQIFLLYLQDGER